MNLIYCSLGRFLFLCPWIQLQSFQTFYSWKGCLCSLTTFYLNLLQWSCSRVSKLRLYIHKLSYETFSLARFLERIRVEIFIHPNCDLKGSQNITLSPLNLILLLTDCLNLILVKIPQRLTDAYESSLLFHFSHLTISVSESVSSSESFERSEGKGSGDELERSVNLD